MPNYSFTFTFEDVGGAKASCQFHLQNSPSEASAKTAAQALAELLQDPSPVTGTPLTNGKLTDVVMSVPLDISAWGVRTTADSDSENQKGGRFYYGVVGGYKGHVTIPTFNEALKLPSGFIDSEDDQVDALQLMLIANNWADYRFTDIVSVPDNMVYTYAGRPATE